MGLDKLTDRARKVLQLAQKESKDLGHNYVGTEHLLLGLLAESSGVAQHVLKNMGISIEKCRAEVLNVLKSDKDSSLEDRVKQLEKQVDYIIRNTLPRNP